MGEIVAHEFVTLDGVMQSPGAADEDREGGFAHGGWQAPYADAESGRVIFEQYAGADTLLLGRKTYDIFAGYWPHQGPDNPFAAIMNRAQKYVASRTLTRVDWQNTSLLKGNVAEEVGLLKGRHSELHLIGSGGLLQTLLRHELVDRLHLWVYPLLLGTGKRLFAEGTIPAALRLATSQSFAGGTVLLTFEFAGKPTYGELDA